jgi:hypothetical protein
VCGFLGPEDSEPRGLRLDDHQGRIDELDLQVLGYSRPDDHRIWTRAAENARVYVRDDGSLLGYGYQSPDGLARACRVDR